jgi:diguanylate cyclase (GGDEF)-like protein/PAS domain S-box-containing protein
MQTTQRKRAVGQRVLGGRSSFNLEDVVNGMQNGFYVADSNGNISFANQAFARMLGYASRDELIGLNMADRLYERKEDRIQFLKRLDESGYVSDYEIRMVRKDGSKVVISVKSSFVSDHGGAPIGVKGIAEEVAKDKVQGRKKERAVPNIEPRDEAVAQDFRGMIRDPLTGLYNYQYFMTCLDAEIRRVECVFHPMSLMIIDVDGFSAYNEKHGRDQGDALLKTMAEVLKTTLRPCDIICRQASDQFLVALPEIKREEALALAKTLKDAVQARLSEQKVTCSIGLARFICGMSAQEYFLQANLGLYMAKEAGKNEACLYG